MPEIESAKRRIPKATYVPLKVDAPTTPAGSAIVKFGYVRNLWLQPGEVDAVRRALAASGGDPIGAKSPLWDLLRGFEGSPMPIQLPSAAALAAVPSAAFVAFGHAIADRRQQALQQVKQATTSPGDSAGGAKFVTARPLHLNLATDLANASYLVNAAITANQAFQANVSAAPIGMLNLERLEMFPAGLERGELLATIPLAPKEQTAVVQKEWSVTTKEFTSIVTDSLDTYSETGVTENTELAQSTTSQIHHSNQFNINATVSGGCGFVTGSVSTHFGTQDSSSASASESRKHAIAMTRKASSRVKQEHKTTISTTTVTGTSESTTRTLQNPSDTNPMRIDYFSIMRKWHVKLFRYGLRLTYDIAIPEPGGALREAIATLADLQAQAALPFSFGVNYSDITPLTYGQLASQYGAAVPPPPAVAAPLTPNQEIPALSDGIHFFQLSFTIPDGYWITDVAFQADIANIPGKGFIFRIEGSGYVDQYGPNGSKTYPPTDLPGFLVHGTGPETVALMFNDANRAWVGFTVNIEPTPSAMAQWVAAVWSALYNAAQTTHYAQQQTISAQIQALQDQINGVDTLTLRREESDEIMKGVLRWLLGTGFDFMPQYVVDLFGNQSDPKVKDNLDHGVAFIGNDLGLSPAQWTTMFQYQEMVKFINEAIEWENVLYFLYSYFWDVPQSWDFIRQIRHPDATRQAFLRSGSARVVLTVRKGYEQAWMAFVELGDFAQVLPPNHPYLTIAQEIQAYDDTHYPGIPPATPGGHPVDQQNESVAVTAAKVAASTSPISIAVDSSVGFVVGNTVAIDTLDSGIQEWQVIAAVPDATHIIVEHLAHLHDGTAVKVPIVQPSESGVLIGEWYEYTPTSGTDIAVTSNLATIA